MKELKGTYSMFAGIAAGQSKKLPLHLHNATSIRARATELNRFAGFKKFSVSVNTKEDLLEIIHN